MNAHEHKHELIRVLVHLISGAVIGAFMGGMAAYIYQENQKAIALQSFQNAMTQIVGEHCICK